MENTNNKELKNKNDENYNANNNKIELLNYNEETFDKIKNPNEDNEYKLTEEEKNKYAKENEALIHYVIKKIGYTNSNYEEIYGSGLLGFAKALDTYKKNKNTKFATYAIRCIKNEILFFLRKETKYTKNTDLFSSILSSDKDGHTLQLEDTISEEDVNKKSLEDTILVEENKKLIEEAMSHLKEEERFIITYRFGLNNQNKKTQKEIANEINMSQANVSKIEKNALRKLKLYIRKEVFYM